MLYKFENQKKIIIGQRRIRLNYPLQYRNIRHRKLRFRFNKFNLMCIAIIILIIIGLSISRLRPQKQLPGIINSSSAPSATLVPSSQQAIINATKATDEYYSIDSAHNHWAYSGPMLCVDITKLNNEELKIWYYVADIKVLSPKAISSGMSDENDPGKNRAFPGDLALKFKAVFSTNGDLYVGRKTGVIIRNGKLWRNKPSEPILAFYSNGDMKVFDPTEKTAQQLLDDGVTNTYAFGPILIRDGNIDHSVLKNDSLRPPNPRTGIGMVEKGHFISILVEGRQPGYSEGITLDNFAMLFQKLGCQTAYNLDGGQSATMMFMGKLLNSHSNDMNGTKWNTYRHVSEIMIFGNSQLIPTTKDTYGTLPRNVTGNWRP
jgi:hypothetical protein